MSHQVTMVMEVWFGDNFLFKNFGDHFPWHPGQTRETFRIDLLQQGFLATTRQATKAVSSTSNLKSHFYMTRT